MLVSVGISRHDVRGPTRLCDTDGRDPAYDAVIVVSFGGPEGPDDVLPFLENVTRGRDVPPERLQAVAEQYERFGE